MLSTAIVIFREALEVAMILGLVLAATRGLKGRMLWLAGGLAGGVAGAGLVAFFANSISEMASGSGQELFNATILFTAAGMIGWTLLWMQKHAPAMVSKIKATGQNIADGNAPFYSLALIVGLAVLREGSEIVLFVYGMIVSGQDLASIASGAVLGLVAGVSSSLVLYYGLIKVPAKYMLRITSWFLIVLVAGLAAQGIGYLSMAGYVSAELSRPIWDSAWLLDEGSIAGKLIHSLTGYSARPSALQILIYVLILIGLFSVTLRHEQAARKTRAMRATTVPSEAGA